MTRQDYIKIAKLLNATQAPYKVIDAFRHLLKEDNPRFNKDKFLNAVYNGRNQTREWGW